MSTTPPRRLLLIGGSSEIGVAIGCQMAAVEPTQAFLIGRDRARLQCAMDQLERGGCTRGTIGVIDARELDGHRTAVETAFAQAGGFEVVVVAVGVLGAQEGLGADPERAVEVMQVTFLGAGSLLLHCLRALRDQGYGRLVVLSSVAAERPRAGNAIYGAAKAGLDALAQGLADANSLEPRARARRPPRFRQDADDRRPAARRHSARRPRSWRGRPCVHSTEMPTRSGSPARLRLLFAVLRHLPRPLYRRLPL